MPGIGGPPIDGEIIDGSGILIWHVDENVIDANFTADLELNQINNDSSHKGIDLEEADGFQYLDLSYPHLYSRGSPFASYRAGNQDYFGGEINPFTSVFTMATAESYYGGVQLEIFDIG